MNRIILFLTCTGLLFACQPQKDQSLMTLEHERDSLIGVYDQLTLDIKEVKDKIADLDTTEKRIAVNIDTVVTEKFEHFLKAQGNVEAEKNAQIFPEIAGNIVAIRVKEGQKVNKDQTLIELDAKILEQNVQEIKTQLGLATTLYEKQQRLWDKKIGSEVQYLEAKTRKESLENSLASLKSQISKTYIKAPFAGTVDEIMLNIGEKASPQFPVARILNLSKMHVEADVSEKHIDKIKEGNSVEIMVVNRSRPINSTIAEVGDYINPNNRTFKIRINIPNAETSGLKPNMIAIININDYQNENAVVISSDLVQQDIEGNEFVYIINPKEDGGIIEKIEIKTGQTNDGKIEILKGLKGGELIVTDGSRSIRNAQEVIIK